MAQEMAKLDLTQMADKLKAKIRDAFIELLPPEQFQALVEAELQRFTQAQTISGQWGHPDKTVPSAFAAVCAEVFREHVKAELKRLLDSPEYQQTWSPERPQLSDAVKEWLTENRQALIETTLLTLAGTAAQDMMQSLRDRLRTGVL